MLCMEIPGRAKRILSRISPQNDLLKKNRSFKSPDLNAIFACLLTSGVNSSLFEVYNFKSISSTSGYWLFIARLYDPFNPPTPWKGDFSKNIISFKWRQLRHQAWDKISLTWMQYMLVSLGCRSSLAKATDKRCRFPVIWSPFDFSGKGHLYFYNPKNIIPPIRKSHF